MKKERLAIVGGGLVGSLWAVYLAKKGHDVHVFDRRSDIRKVKIVQGKSINLALSERGWKGLKGAGIEAEINKVALPMTGRLMHSVQGEITYQPYGKEGQAIYSVSRGLLNQTLLKCADEFENVSLYFDHTCKDLQLDTNTIVFQDTQNNTTKELQFDRIFGTDGAFSAVRARLQRLDRFDYSQEYLSHGYKELEIPPSATGDYQMDPNGLHIWPRGEFMMIALPNPDRSFTCTLFMAFEGKDAFENLNTDDEIIAFFNKYFADAVPLMPELLQDFRNNPTASLVMTKCNPWHYQDKICLMGDAAHAIVPFYGQGMNAGFEDCTVLSQLMDEFGSDWTGMFKEYTRLRKPAGDAILQLALRNYIEMRDKTADERFLLQKKIEARFSAKYPDLWLPLYSQISFSHIPYAEALQNGIEQDEIMKKVMDRPDIFDIWDSEEIETNILRLVNNN
ncbi:MAG: FAD-dependent oxidoreductase [Flavobacteriales bacterium]|jgi:kynurenine 3-monooxygenase